jgi:hypothetical protein
MRNEKLWSWLMLLLCACGGKTTLPAADAGGGGAGSDAGGCVYNGKHYKAGDNFKAGDGCNSCGCLANGKVACTESGCLDAGTRALSWYKTCGAPVCGPTTDGPTGQPMCTTEKVGDACAGEGKLCDPGQGCGVNLVCAMSDPTKHPGGCPISRARYKQDIRYLSRPELAQLSEQLLATPLAQFRYKHDASGGSSLGFIIEDVEPSPSVAGDHVDLYGYTSMAVAALQVQSERVHALEQEVQQLRGALQRVERECKRGAR